MRARLMQIESRDAGGKRVSAKPAEARIWRSVSRILKANVLCSIASISRGRRAHISTAYFCYSDRLEIYFLSHPASVHCRNLKANPSAALAIFSSEQRWGRTDQGLQLFGICSEATGAEVLKARRLYGERFPQYVKWRASVRASDRGGENRFYRFVAFSLQVLDEKSLGDGVLCRADVKGDEN